MIRYTSGLVVARSDAGGAGPDSLDLPPDGQPRGGGPRRGLRGWRWNARDGVSHGHQREPTARAPQPRLYWPTRRPVPADLVPSGGNVLPVRVPPGHPRWKQQGQAGAAKFALCQLAALPPVCLEPRQLVCDEGPVASGAHGKRNWPVTAALAVVGTRGDRCAHRHIITATESTPRLRRDRAGNAA